MIVFDVIKLVINNFLSIVYFTTLAFLVYVVKYYYDYFTRPSKIPGPFPLPLIGNLHQFGSDLVASHEELHKKYGDVYEFYTGNIHNVIISRPDLAKTVWESSTLKNAKFPMRGAYSVGVDELGLGTKGIVLNRNLDTWSYSRKFLIQSISTKPFLRESINLVSQVGDDIFEYWKIMEEKGIQINIPEWMNSFGTDIVIKTATGQNITSRADLFHKSCNTEREDSKKGIWNNGMDFTQAIHTYNGSMIFMMLLNPFIRRNFPVLKDFNKKFLDNRDWIDKELENLISERRKEIDNTPSNQPLDPTILTLLLTTNTDRDLEKMKIGKFDRPLQDNEIGSIIREVFTGGLDTTSNTLSFLFYYIAKDRDVYMKMRNEVLEVYGTLDNPNITYESFDKLKYMDAVIYESIRIFPTIPSIGRAPAEEVELGDYIIKPETTVYTNNSILNRNPKYFKDPEKFNPDRFFTDKEPNERYAFIPFGNGLRVCPGRAWGTVQMKTLLVKLVCKFDIKLADNADLKYIYATTTRPLNVNIHVMERI